MHVGVCKDCDGRFLKIDALCQRAAVGKPCARLHVIPPDVRPSFGADLLKRTGSQTTATRKKG